MIDITIDSTLDDLKVNVYHFSAKKAKEVLGNYFGRSILDPLTTYVDHALFFLKECIPRTTPPYRYCTWAGWTFAGGHIQMFQGEYSRYPGVHMHELGHNFNVSNANLLFVLITVFLL